MHRSSLLGLLRHEVGNVLEWADAGPANVVLGVAGAGGLAQCAEWPGLAGAAALIQAGYERMQDRRNMERLNEVGRALASEQNLDRLLELILTHGRSLVRAEAGSIYLVMDGAGGRDLLFAHTQNARVDLPYHRFRMAVSVDTMAGFTALTGQTLNIPDAYQIELAAPYRFNPSFDRQAGYRTTSMLVLPLTDHEGQVLGVLQFINRLEEGSPVPFGPEQERLALSLAGQAGVAMRNVKLREEIEALFEHFVNASVTAIEQRDPVTSGHSGRVATLTVGLAEAVNRTGDGPFAATWFTPAQLKEIRYASLLHDFGKVGVREEVLVKSKKLPPGRMELILQRLRSRQEERVLARLRSDWQSGRPFDPAAWAALVQEQEQEAGRLMAALIRSNEPTVQTQDVVDGVRLLERLSCVRWDGESTEILEPADLAALNIRKGSLSEAERLEIESHVIHTYQFLAQIPWTPDLASIPRIAYAHHERLNGQGYPRRLTGDEIPLQSKAMAIADIFDALTAQDRPYKAAV
ncbi:MAG: HD domain-containing phosphohydrolase, partial [Holophaga sp.]|nr:HD domain-containing phosphohydrolase [Holophaga sp.]